MNTSRVVQNFQSLHSFLAELQNNMNSAFPEIYEKLDQTNKSDFGQDFLSDLFWSAFELITTVESLPGKEFISWILGAFVEDIHDHIENYPDLDQQIAEFAERFYKTISGLQDQIAPIISDPEGNYDKTFTYQNHVVKVSDFDTFDFIYGGVDYQSTLNVVTKSCKSQAVKKCFLYDRWKIGFWFSENPMTNPCKQCNWGCDGYDDVRELYEDMNQPAFDAEGHKIADNINDYVKLLYRNQPARFYVIEPISASNVRIANYYEDDYKTKYPNGAFINEYCMVWGRDDFFNDWKDFPDDVAEWMFDDINGDGFIDRNDFYYNWGLDAANCMYKKP